MAYAGPIRGSLTALLPAEYPPIDENKLGLGPDCLRVAYFVAHGWSIRFTGYGDRDSLMCAMWFGERRRRRSPTSPRASKLSLRAGHPAI
jgi:hypothetical protein